MQKSTETINGIVSSKLEEFQTYIDSPNLLEKKLYQPSLTFNEWSNEYKDMPLLKRILKFMKFSDEEYRRKINLAKDVRDYSIKSKNKELQVISQEFLLHIERQIIHTPPC